MMEPPKRPILLNISSTSVANSDKKMNSVLEKYQLPERIIKKPSDGDLPRMTVASPIARGKQQSVLYVEGEEKFKLAPD